MIKGALILSFFLGVLLVHLQRDHKGMLLASIPTPLYVWV